MNSESDSLRSQIKRWVSEAQVNDEPASWFDKLYDAANRTSEQVPWAGMKPHPALERWLEHHPAPPTGKSVLVLGCGLGDDAIAWFQAGYQVTAFDISPTAIAWCRERFPEALVDFQVADLFALPSAWQQGFDFAYSSRTIQSLPLSIRTNAIQAAIAPVKSSGSFLMITQLRPEESSSDGPPWPLSRDELALFNKQGLQLANELMISSESQTVWLEYRFHRNA
ncbi:MAG: class I SAM-dependent methyltransferase [Cyanobacteria bacterium P01_H01_bin.15]